ncbi:HK97 gp10 family phage protein [Paenibacillus sp. ACRRX]|uniref:HK97-gp10 family putative phage morphogenesis protein n=1 Tax=Paenibacillus sp. ACRRX TaxID=2918206 RepID=UPI001EF452DD|nr:HK97-gp10 family putative phage morphogenesis protein [Paenibacillus sp. ACRRX]MCG7406779.1 HK97 gp10 family phage protein [Paenibacillus sp. ACRRX]
MTSLSNLGHLVAKLDALGGNSQRALKLGIQQAAAQVQGDAKMLAPSRDGRLRGSIQAKVKERGDTVVGEVSTNVEYAVYVEFGTGQRGEASPSPPKSPEDVRYRQDWAGMQAQPYLYPALKQNDTVVKRLIGKQLRKQIRELGGRR